MPTSVRDILAKTAPWFAARGIPTPQLDAQLLVAHVLGLRRLDLFLHPERELTDAEVARCRDAVRRRGDREPVAYITGRREFLGLDFAVTRDVLVPRPETELLVEVARDFLLRDRGAPRRARRASLYEMIEAAAARSAASAAVAAEGADAPSVVAAPPPPARPEPPATAEPLAFADVGTGSGVVAVCLAHALPSLRGWAIDRSAAALAVARENAQRFGVGTRVACVAGDLLDLADASAPIPEATLDLVVSNPPYVGDGEEAELEPELRHEPREALFAGADGLDLIRRLAATAPRVLRPGGMFACEVGWRQADAVAALLAGPEWTGVARHRDLAGHERVVSARRAGG